jgi:hypothetical protein
LGAQELGDHDPSVSSLAIRYGVYCDVRQTESEEWRINDVYAIAMKDAGVPFVFTGAKSADSGWRKRFMSTHYVDSVKTPIKNWMKYDVLSYLKARKIPIPGVSSGHNANGVDLSVQSILMLHDNYPEDYKKLIKYFPYAEAVVWRRKFYGLQG